MTTFRRRTMLALSVLVVLACTAAVWPVTVDTITVDDGVLTELQVTRDETGEQFRLSEPVTLEPVPSPTPTPTYPPPATEAGNGTGTFLVKCEFDRSAQVDPIMNPGPPGTQSGHLHDFWGGSVDSDSTFESLVAGPTTCGVGADHAGYWAPALINPDGSQVTPDWMRSYYRNWPNRYGTTVTPPDGFKMIVTHDMDSFGENRTGWWWNCHDRDSDSTQFTSPPTDCPSNDLVNLTLMFPSCWNGNDLWLPNNDHMRFASNNSSTGCPQSHPVKIPAIRYALEYDPAALQPGAEFSSGGTIPHADFLDGWVKTDPDPAANEFGLESWLDACSRAGRSCGTVFDGDPLP